MPKVLNVHCTVWSALFPSLKGKIHITSEEIIKFNVKTSILSSCPPEYTKKIISYIFFKISLQIYIIVVRNKKNTYFHYFALKTDNSLFCHRDIPTIHNGYCVSNAVDYAKKNNALPTICQLN